MSEVKIIEVKRSMLDDNDKDADALRKELRERGVFLLNLMSSPGSGKTTTLIRSKRTDGYDRLSAHELGTVSGLNAYYGIDEERI